MTKRISQQTEAKLMDVLSKVAELTAAGDNPNTAIVKAGEGRLRPGEIELVVRAYNIGRTNCQREDNDSLFEKNATFELADSDIVTEQLFPSAVKTAAQHTLSTVVSSDYTQPGVSIARQMKMAKAPIMEWPAAPPMEKQAREQLDTRAHARRVADLHRATREYENKRAAHRSTVQKLAQTVNAFGDYFRGAGAHSQATVKAAATILHGEVVTNAVFTAMAEAQPGLTKIASAKRPATKLAASDPVLRMFTDVVAAAAACKESHAAVTALAGGVTEKRAEMYPAKSVAVPAGNSVLDADFKKKAFLPSIKDIGNSVNNNLSALKGYGDTRTATEPAVQKALYELTDPDHEEQLRQLQAQTSFQELLARDKVLQGYDPRHVADAYSQVTQASPNLATQPMALQALMRKQLEQGHMDTFDVNDMIGMNNNLQSRFSGMNDMQQAADHTTGMMQ
jgi:hypothetical protein